VTLLAADGSTQEVPLMAKGEVAEVILDRIEGLLRGR
jgi:phosphopantothenoylcysteine synthetase/decarboxylase